MPISASEWVSIVGDAIVAISALGTASAAIWGLRSWHRELQGKAQFDVARSLIKATYSLRNELQYARSRLILAQEFPVGFHEEADSRTSRAKKAAAYQHMFARRWEPIWPALKEFDAYSLEAEVFWGDDIRTATGALRDAVTKLRTAADAWIANEASEGEDFRSDDAFAKQIRAEVFASPAKAHDPLSKQIADAVVSIESHVRPHLLREKRKPNRLLCWARIATCPRTQQRP